MGWLKDFVFRFRRTSPEFVLLVARLGGGGGPMEVRVAFFPARSIEPLPDLPNDASGRGKRLREGTFPLAGVHPRPSTHSLTHSLFCLWCIYHINIIWGRDKYY